MDGMHQAKPVNDETKFCDFCLTGFSRAAGAGQERWRSQRFCSMGCRINHLRARFGHTPDHDIIGLSHPPEPAYWSETKTCPGCGKDFGPYRNPKYGHAEGPSAWSQRICCSVACSNRARHGRQEPAIATEASDAKPNKGHTRRKWFPAKVCEKCQKTFRNPHLKDGTRRYSPKQWQDLRFCGLSCSASARMLEVHRRKREQAALASPSEGGDLFRELTAKQTTPTPPPATSSARALHPQWRKRLEELRAEYAAAKAQQADDLRSQQADELRSQHAEEEAQAEWLIQLMEPNR
jgi:hypothetical protein